MNSEPGLTTPLLGEKALLAFALLLVGLWAALASAGVYSAENHSLISYMHSALFDFDLHFGNEFTFWKTASRWNHLTASGHVSNGFAVGSAILWMPFYLLGFLGTFIQNLVLETPLQYDGTNQMFRYALALGTGFYAVAGLMLATRVASYFTNARSAVWATLFVAIGTPFLYYSSVGALYSHIPSAFMLALFMDRLLCSHNRAENILFTGLAAGFLIITDWYAFVFLALLPLSWWLNRRWNANQCLYFVFGLIFALLPQEAVWWKIYGSPLAVQGVLDTFGNLDFAVFKYLFSIHHGMFVWSPLLLLCFVGLLLMWKIHKRPASLLLLSSALFVLLCSLYDWSSGYAFGARRFLTATPVMVVGLAVFLRKLSLAKPWTRLIFGWMLLLLVLWSLLLLGVFVSHFSEKEHISLLDLWQRTLLYLGGNGGNLPDSVSSSFIATQGGQAMAIVAFVLLFGIVSLFGRYWAKAWLVLVSIAALYIGAVALRPVEIRDYMNVGEWHNWQKWQEFNSRGPESFDEVGDMARKSFNLKMFPQSAKLYCLVASKTKTTLDVYNCSYLRLILGQRDAAENAIKLAEASQGEDERLYYLRGSLEFERFNFERSAYYLNKSYKARENIASLLLKGRVFEEMNRLENAAAVYRQILESSPDNKAAMLSLEKLTQKGARR